MLRLKEIYALPVAPPPDITIEPSHENLAERWDGSKYSNVTYHYKYTTRRVTVGEELLETTAYSYDGIPLWRTWQTKDRVVGQKLCNPTKPIESTIGSLTAYDTRGDFFTDQASEEAAMTWVRTHLYPLPAWGSYCDGHKIESTLDMLGYSQIAARHKKRDDERNRIRREVDNAMLEIREPPKTFAERVLHDGFAECHYIIYRYEPKKAKLPGYCTRCRHDVTVTEPRNHKSGKCPRCHSPITFLSAGTLAQCSKVLHKKGVIYLQSTREGFCLRTYSAVMSFDKETFFEPELKLFEQHRSFYSFATDDHVRHFTWGEPWPSTPNAWCQSNLYATDAEGYLYPDNLNGLLQKSRWRYLPMADIARNISTLPVASLLRKVKEDAAIEHLAKHGLWKLVYDRITEHQSGWQQYWESSKGARDIRQALGGMNISDVRLLRQLNPTSLQLALYRLLRDEGVATLENTRSCFSLGLETIPQALTELMGYTTLHRILRYCREQLPNMEGNDPATILKDWQDYLHDAKKLKWDVHSEFVLFPANLREAHKQSIDTVDQVVNAKKYKKLAGVLAKYIILEYQDRSLLIRLPHNGPEIQAEGKALHHCVGGYVDRVAEGQTLIFFIRKCDSPEVPFYTLELDPKSMTVVQARGTYNCKTTDLVSKFISKWKKHLEDCKQERPRTRQRVRATG